KYLLADRVPDGLELEERGDLPGALRVRIPVDHALHVVCGRSLEVCGAAVGARDVDGVDVHVRGQPRGQLVAATGQQIARPAWHIGGGKRLCELDRGERMR